MNWNPEVSQQSQQSPRDEFAVKAAADENDGVRVAEVKRAGQHALMPEAVDFSAGFLSVDNGRDAVFRDHFEAPRKAHEPQKRPDHAGNNGQNNALAKAESWAGVGGH